jgi:hypothetical protein
MIQRPASGTLDLELRHLADSGEKSFALFTFVQPARQNPLEDKLASRQAGEPL